MSIPSSRTLRIGGWPSPRRSAPRRTSPITISSPRTRTASTLPTSRSRTCCRTNPAYRCATRKSGTCSKKAGTAITGCGRRARTNAKTKTPGTRPGGSALGWAALLGCRGGSCCTGRAAAGLKPLAQLLGALLELLLEALLLLLEHLGIDRRAVESLAEPGKRHREGDLAADLILHADVDMRALLHRGDHIVLQPDRLGEAAVREADGVGARDRRGLVH